MTEGAKVERGAEGLKGEGNPHILALSNFNVDGLY